MKLPGLPEIVTAPSGRRYALVPQPGSPWAKVVPLDVDAWKREVAERRRAFDARRLHELRVDLILLLEWRMLWVFEYGITEQQSR